MKKKVRGIFHKCLTYKNKRNIAVVALASIATRLFRRSGDASAVLKKLLFSALFYVFRYKNMLFVAHKAIK